MRRLKASWLLAGALPALMGGTVFQGCTVLLPYHPGPFVLDLTHGIPHFDGDGEDSLLDRIFGYDDDDVDWDDDDWDDWDD
jgi:hypothetical protein